MKPNFLDICICPTSETYLPYLEQQGFPHALSIYSLGSGEAALCLREAVVRVLSATTLGSRLWSYSAIGPLERGANLQVLNLLEEHEFQVTARISETFKESDSQAFTTCEIVFTAPIEFMSTLMRCKKLGFGFKFMLCGWLLDQDSQRHLIHRFKYLDSDTGFTMDRSVPLGFASSRDWDRVEFFSADKNLLIEAAESVRNDLKK